jgi:hypothetical protein
VTAPVTEAQVTHGKHCAGCWRRRRRARSCSWSLRRSPLRPSPRYGRCTRTSACRGCLCL